MTKRLKAKHEVFCHEFFVDLNATQTAIRAGYAAKRAPVTSDELYGKPEIHSRINELKHERIDQPNIGAHDVPMGAADRWATLVGDLWDSARGVQPLKSVGKASVSDDTSTTLNPDAVFWNHTQYGAEFCPLPAMSGGSQR